MKQCRKLEYTQVDTINSNTKDVNTTAFCCPTSRKRIWAEVAVAMRRVLLSNITSLLLLLELK